MAEQSKVRYWEIDTLRGIAIIMMIIYHGLVDVELVSGIYLPLTTGFWKYFQTVTAALFLMISGTSLVLSTSNLKSPNELVTKLLKRGTKIFSFGIIITIVTKIALGNSFIIFGILHLMGLATIIAIPLLRLEYTNLVAGIAMILIGNYLYQQTFPFSYLLWLGFIPRGFSSFDYFPLLPWFGYYLIGIFLGNKLFASKDKPYQLLPSKLSNFSLIRLLSFLGKNSLVIYLLHQPLLLAMIALFFFIFPLN